MLMESRSDNLDAVIKIAQHVAGLTGGQDVWAEFGQAFAAGFAPQLIAFAGRRPDGGMDIHACLSSETGACDRLSAEADRIAGLVLDSGRPLTRKLHWPRACSVTALPLMQEGRPIAAMLVGCNEAAALPQDQFKLFVAIAGLFSSALSRIAAEHHFTSMADIVPEMLFQMYRHENGQARFSYVSKGSGMVLGVPPEELLANAALFTDAIHAVDRKAYEMALAEGDENRRVSLRLRWADRSGAERHLLFTALPSAREDGGVTWFGAAQDITECDRLEVENKRSLEKMEKAMEDIVYSIATTIEMRDPYTAGHQRRVAEFACRIAEELGLPEEDIHGIYLAAIIHDIGKVHIPSEILSFPGKLGEIEFALVKSHVQAGYDIVKNIEFPWPVAQMVYQHHEHVDGSGYPRGLKGKDILIGAQIICVADVVESIASFRPYRSGLGTEQALAEIEKNRGKFYEPAVADACLRLIREKGYQVEYK
jgi:putative nucleotidyltransferase with HDIG domain